MATAAGSAREPFVIPLALGLVGRDGQVLPMRLEDEPESAAATERVLVLDETRAFFTFVGVEQPPVLSLLRGFSAPVCLVDGLGDAELLVLLRHDSDPFNRWEAGQRLALSRLVAAAASGNDVVLDAPFIGAMRDLLTSPDLDPAFKELVLTLPSEAYIAEQMDSVEPQRIHAARESMRRQLAEALTADWERAFESNQVGGGYSPDAGPAGRRALANLALAMLCVAARAARRYGLAGPRLSALQGCVEHDRSAGCAERPGRLRRRAGGCRAASASTSCSRTNRWSSTSGSRMQAAAPEQDGRVFERVKRLMKHPDFSLTNPNRARSLISSFCMRNPAAFHRADGAGYGFWADRVLELDAINPQLASRLARALDRWPRLAEPYRSAAHAAIARVAAHAKLSSDTREIVSRALAAA